MDEELRKMIKKLGVGPGISHFKLRQFLRAYYLAQYKDEEALEKAIEQAFQEVMEYNSKNRSLFSIKKGFFLKLLRDIIITRLDFK